MENKQTKVQFKNIKKSFGKVNILDSLNLNVKNGEFLSLLGPSGCGKSTTLNILAGFLKPDSGDMLASGNSLLKLPAHKRELGMVFQRYTLFPHMNIFNNIAFGLKQRKINKTKIQEKVTESLKLVGLPHIEQRFPKELSGGQQQRVALARALVVEPKIFLLDEPLSSLDAKLRKYMQVELRRIHEELNLTSIYVTHDQEEAFVMSDRIALMNKGQIEQLDTPENIYENPKTEFVANFIGNSNIISSEIVQYDNDVIKLTLHNNITLFAKNNNQHQNLKIGDKVKTVLREERLNISKHEDTNMNSVPVKIKRIIFQGSNIRYLCEINNLEIWTVQSSSKEKLLVGSEVYLNIASKNVKVVEESIDDND